MTSSVTFRAEILPLDRGLLIEPLRRVGDDVASQARLIVPVDTSYLKRTIFVQVLSGGAAGYVAVVGADAHYALYVHEGTGIYGPRKAPIIAAPGKVFRFTTRGGDVVFTTRIKGQKPQPFLRDALTRVGGLRVV